MNNHECEYCGEVIRGDSEECVFCREQKMKEDMNYELVEEKYF